MITATYTKSDSLPSSPASTAATGDLFVDNSPSESDIDIERSVFTLVEFYFMIGCYFKQSGVYYNF